MLNSGKDLSAVLQSLEVSEATYHRWRTQYGGMKSDEAKRLKELEIENARLKRLLADAELDNDAQGGTSGKRLSPTQKRETVHRVRNSLKYLNVGHAEDWVFEAAFVIGAARDVTKRCY